MEATLAQYTRHGLPEQNDVALMDRMDTKYVLPEAVLDDCLRGLTGHYTVLEMEGQRQFGYSTLYFDTPGLDFYRAHHNGKLNRNKVRLRHYCQSRRTFLEVKLKNNQQRTIKQRLELSGPELGSREAVFFLQAALGISPGELSPSLWVRYNRITLINPERTERVTLDRDLGFQSTRVQQQMALPGLVVVEVKTARKAVGSAITAVLKSNRIQPLSLSKYCTGIALTHAETIKRNAFKPLLNQLDIMRGSSAHVLNT